MNIRLVRKTEARVKELKSLIINLKDKIAIANKDTAAKLHNKLEDANKRIDKLIELQDSL